MYVPVFPAVPSTTVPPGLICPTQNIKHKHTHYSDITSDTRHKPFSSAFFIRKSAALSLTEPPQLRNSALTKISHPIKQCT